MTSNIQNAVDAFTEVSTYSEQVTPKHAFEFIANYKAETGHRPSLSAMTLLYLREKARADKAEREVTC